MPASLNSVQAVRIPMDCQSQRIQTLQRIRSSSYHGFSLIAIDPENVAIIIVNVEAVVHRIMFCVYQFHCYQSLRLKWRKKAQGLILDLKDFSNRYNNHKMYHFINIATLKIFEMIQAVILTVVLLQLSNNQLLIIQ